MTALYFRLSGLCHLPVSHPLYCSPCRPGPLARRSFGPRLRRRSARSTSAAVCFRSSGGELPVFVQLVIYPGPSYSPTPPPTQLDCRVCGRVNPCRRPRGLRDCWDHVEGIGEVDGNHQALCQLPRNRCLPQADGPVWRQTIDW